MARSKKPPDMYLRVRHDEFVSYAWLIEKDGPASSGLLYGQLLNPTAERLIAWANATGIRVEIEDRRCTTTSCDSSATCDPSADATKPGSSPVPSTRTDEAPAAGSETKALF